MARFLLRRLLLGAALLLLVASLSFVLVELAPGDASLHLLGPDQPAELQALMRARWGLDRPAWLRYLAALGNLCRGDFGASLVHGRPALMLIAEAAPHTLLLSGLALVLSFGLGIPLGIWQARHANDSAGRLVGLLGLGLYAAPRFWLGLLLIILLAGRWALLPASGVSSWDHGDLSPLAALLDRAAHLLLPLLALGLPGAAGVARYLRASMIEAMQGDYVRSALATGLHARRVLWRHALPNALLPVITLAGLSFPFLFSGSVLVEEVFSWPGMGRLMVHAILDRDTPLVIACFFFFAIFVVLGNLLADLAAAALDPRLRDSLVDDA